MSMSVCVFVCMLVHSHNSKITWLSFTKFFCMLPNVLGRSSSGGVAIRYVLPVLWMTSCFHIMALWRFMCIPKRRWNTTSVTAEISSESCSTIKTSKNLVVSCVPGPKPVIRYCLAIEYNVSLELVARCSVYWQLYCMENGQLPKEF